MHGSLATIREVVGGSSTVSTVPAPAQVAAVHAVRSRVVMEGADRGAGDDAAGPLPKRVRRASAKAAESAMGDHEAEHAV